MPRIKTIAGYGDVEEGFDLGSQAPPELREGGFDISDVQPVSEKDFQSAVAVEKFMNELVQVEIEADDDEHAPVFVYTGHSGVVQYIKRGEVQTVKRKFLYSLLAAKRVKMSCAFGIVSGNEFNRLTPNSAMTHRARLVRDNNPQGGASWVQKVMREAA